MGTDIAAAPQADTDWLISSLYDAVMAPMGFQDFIENLCRTCRLKSVSMVTRHGQTQEIKGHWLYGIGGEWVARYALEYAREDLLAHHMMLAPIASFYASNLDLGDPARFAQSRFYREWVAPQGVAYAAGGIVLREGDWLTQIILQRSPAQAPFTRGELDQLDLLIPHLQRAIQMRNRFTELELTQNFLASSLDVLVMPAFLFDEYGRVAHANSSAEELVHDRALIWLENNHLFVRDEQITRSINHELGNAIRASRGMAAEPIGTVVLPRRGKLPLLLMIAPMRLSGRAAPQGAALMFAFDPAAAPAVAVDVVKSLFALTDAEAQLAVSLSGGNTLQQAADQRGTSIHTIRAQLKSIFSKTGTKRQADLISLLLSSPAYFLARQATP